MKLLVFLLAAAAAFPFAKPNAEVRLDSGGPANSATAATEATALVIFRGDTVRAEVANTPETRGQGLMFRDAVPDGTGMLFVFDREAQRSQLRDRGYPADGARNH